MPETERLPADFRIVSATRADVPLIFAFIRELAEYEKLSQQVVATEARLTEDLFGPRPIAEVLLAYQGSDPVGFALYFENYSTFLSRRGIYLEDLFVRPAFRGKGYGKSLLAALARVAVERGCHRLEWAVLDWNEPAIGFYHRLGARPLEDWRIFRLTGDPLSRLAGESNP